MVKLNPEVYSALESVGIEYTGGSLRSVRCPKCADERTKSGARTLQIYVEPPYLRWRCFHTGCEWGEIQYKRIGSVSIEEDKEEPMKFKNIPEGTTLPIDKTHAVYHYKDIDGNTLYVGARTEDKSFYYVSIMDTGQIAYRARPVKALYGAETIKGAPTVAVVEGEKARDAAVSLLKYPVVTWPGGAQAVERGDWELLKGKNVIIFPDNDEPGQKAAQELLKLIPADKIAIADVSKFPPKGDLADNIPAETIQEAIKNALIYEKPKFGLDNVASVDSLLADLEQEIELEGMGWSILDSTIRLPKSGLMVVEGRSGHGKTTFMLNMLWNKILQGKTCLFYSYEMPASRILMKLVMIAEGVMKHKGAHENHLAYKQEILEGKSKGLELVKKYLGKTLFILDENYPADTLQGQLDQSDLANAYVFIDYIQIIPFKGSGEARYLEIKKLSEQWRAVANKHNYLIVTGAQLTSGEQPLSDVVREGKDINNSAELTVRFWNINAGNTHGAVRKDLSEELSERVNRGELNCILDIRKNRNGELGGKFYFLMEGGFKLTEVGNGKSLAHIESVNKLDESEKNVDF